jgi:DNA (cytosine-5)-methyltransferase 1
MQNQTTLSPLRCNPLLYGSLFSGIGGIDLGFDRAGLKCAWQVEIDPFARKVLDKHWPGVPKHDDIRTFKPAQVDVVCGGFPCQDISNAGKREGIDGKRSGLWAEMFRIVCEIRPRFVVVENVSALRNRGLDRVLGNLASSGYDAEWSLFSACQMGAPHTRERMFIVAYSNSQPCNWEQCSRIERTQDRDKKWNVHEQWTRNEPSRVADGIPNSVDANRCLGNAVVPVIAEWIGRRLIESV